MSYTKSNYLNYILFFYALLSIVILSIFNGTGQEADSINHYLYARYALNHPELLLNHWAKPLFTLLAMPFAQFGFIGVKFFNFLCSFFCLYYLIQIAQSLNWKRPYLAAIFFILFPLSFITTFSGFTEPLFALMVLISIYCIIHNKYTLATILISFSPFIRSEGLIIIGVFALYLLIQKNYKYMLWLVTGHCIYGLVGSFYYGDLLWVFNKIPYAELSTPYGRGNFFHFFEQLNYALGIPLYILFWFGFISILIRIIKDLKNSKIELLILLCFTSFFLSHNLFWQLGIFNSMGLKRVFAAISPLMALISLYGFNQISLIPHAKTAKTLQALMLCYILIFPFTSNPAALNWKSDLNLSIAQQNAEKAADFIKANYEDKRIVYADPYLVHALGIDPFDPKEALMLNQHSLQSLGDKDIILWDNWHAVIDGSITFEQIENKTQFKAIKYFVKKGDQKESKIIVFEKTIN